jgi:hypothetical protein
MQGKERGACRSALLTGGSVALNSLLLDRPGRLKFDPIEHFERIAD